MFCVRPYLASKPASALRSWTTAGVVMRLVVRSEIAYGLSSMVLESDGASSPTSVASVDPWYRADWPRAAGTCVMYEISFFHRLVRNALRPQTCSRPGL